MDDIACGIRKVSGKDDVEAEAATNRGDWYDASCDMLVEVGVDRCDLILGGLVHGLFLVGGGSEPESFAVLLSSSRDFPKDLGVLEAEVAVLLFIEGESSSGGGVRAVTADGVDASSSGTSLLLSTYLLSLSSETIVPRMRISVSLPMLRRDSILCKAYATSGDFKFLSKPHLLIRAWYILVLNMVRQKHESEPQENSRSKEVMVLFHNMLNLLKGLVFLPIEPFDFLSIRFPGFSSMHFRRNFLPRCHAQEVDWTRG